ncbi:MAG TPA: DUF6220 domain-containing protein [Candidatus Limnocylindrales bacterium]|jgi:cytochrome b561|nr:DUF6220 domain-containing protein [Candidatus Limnocylindrales bacterium]
MSSARWARIGFTLVAWLFAAGMVIEFYLAGQGLWATPGNYELHRNVGYLFGVLPLVLVVLSLAGGMPRLLVGASALLLGLTVVQVLLVVWPDLDPNVAALHPVVGLFIVVLAVWTSWSSLRQIRAPMSRPAQGAQPADDARRLAPPTALDDAD